MDKKRKSSWLTDEVASFLAQCPSQDALLAYRPSSRAQKRFSALQAKSENGFLSADVEWELDQKVANIVTVCAATNPAHSIPTHAKS